ncbi:DUF4382 domain-containing protein [Aestuariibacter sp. AA17]|uniref:DUF4382 domain-containing protein n=1 Tax=Fluctibacter corallii TaxID=2984329 RepID=A0ABT3A8J3_9ALTE|nr:DUF4382 domain-containing protein [Aestuariibacter sp. AA17]MCV2884988.1 DUF4382 domain-containing protein [Aestuariibacter sp. AA17]
MSVKTMPCLRTAICLAMLSVLSGCGGSSSSNSAPSPSPSPSPAPSPTDARLSFAVSDAPVDEASAVVVSFSSITLVPEDENAESVELAITDDNGDPSYDTINLLDYQGSEQKLLLQNMSVTPGVYKNLIINTYACPQNQNGDSTFCYVEDTSGIKPLKTPSNKLQLGGITVSEGAQETYVLEFNLRSSLVSTANGQSFNLKPQGISIVSTSSSGKVIGTVDPNILNNSLGCETVFAPNTDHGKSVYLYSLPAEGEVANVTLTDEFDANEASAGTPENALAPMASIQISLSESGDVYEFDFGDVAAGNYLIAFSCSAINDDPVEYDAIQIPNPENQQQTLSVTAGSTTVVEFVE